MLAQHPLQVKYTILMGTSVQEMTREIYLEVDPLTPKSQARNLRTSTISFGGGAMTHLDPDPVSGNGAS